MKGQFINVERGDKYNFCFYSESLNVYGVDTLLEKVGKFKSINGNPLHWSLWNHSDILAGKAYIWLWMADLTNIITFLKDDCDVQKCCSIPV